MVDGWCRIKDSQGALEREIAGTHSGVPASRLNEAAKWSDA